MFKIDDTTIKLTRGDIAVIEVSAENNEGENYKFKAGDIVRLKVFMKKDCSNIVMHKDVTVTEEGPTVNISLTSEDTKIGELINKKATYWYEIELNPDTAPQTIVGIDDDGEKLFILYPEGADIDD